MLGLRRDAVIGVAVAGVMVGGLTGTIFAEPGESRATDDTEATTPSTGAPALVVAPPAADPKLASDQQRSALLPIVTALETAHARLHSANVGSQASADGMPTDFRTTLMRTKKFMPLLRDFFREAGTGTFISGGRLTALGKALMARLVILKDHGLNPKAYGMPGVGEAVRRFVSKSAGGDVQSPAAAGPAGPVMVSLLQAGNFNFDRALKRLSAAGGTPAVSHVSQIAGAMGQARTGRGLQMEEYELEVKLGAALLRFVLDHRILRRAGPFKVTRNEEAFAMYKRRPKKALKYMLEVSSSPDPATALAELEPRHQQYRQLVEAYKRYQTMAKSGCHAKLPRSWQLWKGKKNTTVETKKLQERLACEGYYKGAIDGDFNQKVKEAVQTYQRHHELEDGGFVKGGTIASLNVKLERRAEVIALTLQRMRESLLNEAEDFVIRVNIPQFEMQAFQGHELLRRHKVIVGTNKLDDDKVKLVQGHINRTTLFKTKLYEVIVNPDWILPTRVEKGELRTKVANNPNYLKEHNIRKITLPSGRVALIQGRGEHNVLGQVKFMLEKSRAIFLHDTNDRSMFRFERRDFSHGCVRVQKAPQFARWLLARDGYTKKDIERTFKAKRTQRGMKMRKPIDLVTEYMTVDISEEGLPIFLDDIYGFDRSFFKGDLPPKVTARWGGPILRPNWVPRVPENIVEGWRRSGQAAPRTYTGPIESNTP